MADAPAARFSFTKLVVADLERMAALYKEVYCLAEVATFAGEVC